MVHHGGDDEVDVHPEQESYSHYILLLVKGKSHKIFLFKLSFRYLSPGTLIIPYSRCNLEYCRKFEKKFAIQFAWCQTTMLINGIKVTGGQFAIGVPGIGGAS